MKRKWVVVFVGFMFFILTCCTFPPHSNYYPLGTAKALTAAATVFPAMETATTVPSPTSEPPTPTQVVVQVPVNLAYPPDISNAAYLDDRSTPAALILSYYNAVNRREYLRAYSYYGDGATGLGSFEGFSNGYTDTDSVSVVLGEIGDEGAAGSIYYSVPMVLNAVTTDQAQQKYAACYILRLSQPGNYGAPPITPMHIERGIANPVSLSMSDADALSSACTGPDFPQGLYLTAPGLEPLIDLSSANYIDNRSGDIELVSSYLNAINRYELVRAYSYWKNPVVYTDFETEYTDWGQSEAIFGIGTADAGAGQLYYTLPVVLQKQMPDGTMETLAACFVMHLSQPTFQASPPFDPLGIVSITYTTAPGTVDLAAPLLTACP